MGLEREAKQWMKERQLTTLTATYYQARACETAIFPKHQAMEYLTLGLTGEAGEIANKVKKFIRDGYSQEELPYKINDLRDELGDVLWYVAAMAQVLDTTLEQVAKSNIHKLAERQVKGTLTGSGDKR